MRIRVLEGNATAIEADVLALKFAQARYGLDAVVADHLRGTGLSNEEMSPRPGCFNLVGGVPEILAGRILFVGVEPLGDFEYSQVRGFARTVLWALAQELPDARHLLITVHGPGFGLDENEAFESQLAGFLDAVADRTVPRSLEVITVVEQNKGRARRLQRTLEAVLPGGVVKTTRGPEGTQPQLTGRLRTAGRGSASKAHVFVAMPFADEMDDVYHYGIMAPVRGAGFLCERADLSAFTGDVIAWVKDRISTASLVIAELSGANPNVYLEVGFAWGCGIPTVLLSRDTTDLRFDVRGQRCLVYKKIKDLETTLAGELTMLKATSGASDGSRGGRRSARAPRGPDA